MGIQQVQREEFEMNRKYFMKYVRTTPIILEYIKSDGCSFGIHFCWHGRVDIHFLVWVLSIGNVPLYRNNKGTFAVSNSYHSNRNKHLPNTRLRN
jgi:hypothetical protein